ncbi:MAG: (2Fe-2S)-binding protein, partial [Calditrichia bacterium]|nr:(2Fe-2S)-binding protein [Calditrichia bacterium]
EKAEVLKSHPGNVFEKELVEVTEDIRPILHCFEEIPCNPCTSVCPKNSINLKDTVGNIMDIPEFSGECTGCGLCVLVCPGLAVTLAKKVNNHAEVVLPHEYLPTFKVGDEISLTDFEGKFLEKGEVLKIRHNKKYKTWMITVKTTLKNAQHIAGIVVQNEEASQPLPETSFEYIPENGYVCQCEMVTVKEVVDYIKEHEVRDVNQLKNIRVGMGACGGKNCSVVLPRVFGMAGVDYWKEVTEGSKRPLTVEVPMSVLINEK